VAQGINREPDDMMDSSGMETLAGDHPHDRAAQSPPIRQTPKQHFCHHCGILQPYRTRHCKVCQCCVAKFDHHCFWVGGCVGELNHGRFIIMLATMTPTFAFVTFWVNSLNLQTWDMWNMFTQPDSSSAKYYLSSSVCLMAIAGFVFVVDLGNLPDLSINVPHLLGNIRDYNMGECPSREYRLCEGLPKRPQPISFRDPGQPSSSVLCREAPSQVGAGEHRGGMEKPPLQLLHQPIL
jgi:DHHC palmitoyltransferase